MINNDIPFPKRESHYFSLSLLPLRQILLYPDMLGTLALHAVMETYFMERSVYCRADKQTHSSVSVTRPLLTFLSPRVRES